MKAIKKTEMMSFEGKWMELEIIMLRKISQTQKACFLSYEKSRPKKKMT
jgi:hypothetical protein